MFVDRGYYDVNHVSVISMITQDILRYFKDNSWSDWRCCLSSNLNSWKEPIAVDRTRHNVHLSLSVFSKIEYRDAYLLVMETLSECDYDSASLISDSDDEPPTHMLYENSKS